jgi:pSer/pThr/pTyr-binding forkhead associated (FHA) protein
MTAVLFLLRAVILILLWGFVIAAIVAVRHDIVGGRPRRQQAPPQPRPAPAPRAPKAGRLAARKLVVVDGAAAGITVELTGEPITIGRADDSTITLTDDDYVSTRHARLVLQDGAWLIEDLGSTNGTYVDRQRVTALTPVTLGVPIRIGKTVLELRK